jgi:hypothetical protein
MPKSGDPMLDDLNLQLNTFKERLLASEKDLRKYNELVIGEEKALEGPRKTALESKWKERVIGKRIWQFLAKCGDWVIYTLKIAAHYIVVVLVVYLMLYGFGKLTSMALPVPAMPNVGAKVDEEKRKGMNVFQRLIYDIKTFFQSILNFFNPGYRIKSFFAGFRSTEEATLPRMRISSGRCDNTEHIEISGGGGQEDMCVTSKVPKPLQWTIDTSTMPEWDKLPQSFKDANKEKLSVYMPYATETVNTEDSFFAPQCAATYYVDSKGVHQPINLYTNGGVTCDRINAPRTLFDTPKTLNGTGDGYV